MMKGATTLISFAIVKTFVSLLFIPIGLNDTKMMNGINFTHHVFIAYVMHTTKIYVTGTKELTLHVGRLTCRFIVVSRKSYT